MRWDEEIKRWRLTTNRGDDIRARFVVMAQGRTTGPSCPASPASRTYAGGHSFHSARWDYDYTGGDASGGLHKLADKRVALVGTGATGVQLVPHLGRDAKQLFVFQRTPSIGRRARQHARPTRPGRSPCSPGWQKERKRNFHYWSPFVGVVLRRAGSGVRLLDRTRAATRRPGRRRSTIPPRWRIEQFMAIREEEDYKIMERLRRRVGSPRRRPRHRRGAQAVLPVHVQAAVFQRRLPADVQPAQRDAGRRVGIQGRGTADREGHRRQRRRVRGRLHHLRQRLRDHHRDQPALRHRRHRGPRRAVAVRLLARQVTRRCTA